MINFSEPTKISWYITLVKNVIRRFNETVLQDKPFYCLFIHKQENIKIDLTLL